MTRRFAAIFVLGAALAALVSASARGDTGNFVAGSGNAYAQFVRVGPTAARLSLAPTLGLSLADYAGTVGRGQASSADLAAIGVAQPCLDAGIPRLRVTSQDPGASQGKTTYVAGQNDDSGNGGGIGQLFARATTAPFGESTFRFGAFSIPGFMTVGEGFAHSTAGVIKGDVRQATATVEISSFDFAGAVHLGGLRWEAVQQTSDKGRKVSSTFTVQNASVGGVPLNLPVGGGDLNSILGPLNAALAPTGFSLQPPVNDSLSGVASMSPLSIQMINSPLGRQTIGPALAAIQPIREPLADELISFFKSLAGPTSNDCGGAPSFPDLSVSVLVADLSLGILAGSSDFHLELGGVNAYTEGQRFASPFGPPQRPPLPGTRVDTLRVAGVPGLPGTPGTPGTPGSVSEFTASSPGRQAHVGGGVLAGIIVGLIGLAVSSFLAVGDWYRMRRLA